LEEILDKAAGNPFYLEEVVRSLIDAGAVVREEPEQDYLSDLVGWAKGEGPPKEEAPARWQVTAKIDQITVPDSLQGAIVARIDRLTEDARHALQLASVIGRQFRLEILRHLTEAEAEIDLWLAQLERGGLVRPAADTLDLTYAFPDALVQEVAYESLLVQSRQRLHARIGETLENAFGQDLEQGAELLAYHFSRSTDRERALKYLKLAAGKAKESYANETAIQYYQQMLEILRRQGDEAGQASALYNMGVMAYEIGSYERARAWLQESIDLLEQLDDGAAQGWSVMYLGMVDLKQGNYSDALHHHGLALDLARMREDSFQEGIHLTNLARVTMRMGQYERAMEQFGESLEIKRRNKDLVGQGFALFYRGLIHIDRGRYEEAQGALEGAIEVWEQLSQNDRVVSYYEYGRGLLALGREAYAEAEAHLERALALAEKLVLKAEIIENLSALALAKLGEGQTEEAQELSRRAVELLERQKDVEEVQRVYLNHYHILEASADPKAHRFLRRAREVMEERAQRIVDEEARQIYLEEVQVNQVIRNAR
jgi:tetratricopeptide (TPR) repeat protein